MVKTAPEMTRDIYSRLPPNQTNVWTCALLCPQTLACLSVSPARCHMMTIKWGGPRCHGWALGRPGVDEAALGHIGSRRLRVSRERARTSTRLHWEEKEAAKADSTQVLDGLYFTLWKVLMSDEPTEMCLFFLFFLVSFRIWGHLPVQSPVFPVRSDSEGAWWC